MAGRVWVVSRNNATSDGDNTGEEMVGTGTWLKLRIGVEIASVYDKPGFKALDGV